MSATVLDVEAVRSRFSSLRGGFTYLDALGGSQVPDEVVEAISHALRDASGNLGAPYETGRRVEAIVDRARADAGRFLNCSPDDVVFGTNMTVLDFTLSRTASRDWKEGDRILVSRLDHDGGVAPWIELAADRHLGVAYGRHELLESWRPYKARPASNSPVGRRFEPGTAPYELFAGFSATIAYLESIGGMEVLRAYEHDLGQRFLDGLPDAATVYGEPTMEGRLPTFLFNLEGVPATEIAETMAARGYGVWAHDSWYSLGLRERLPYPDEAVRVGLIHYNTAEEVDGFLTELGSLAA